MFTLIFHICLPVVSLTNLTQNVFRKKRTGTFASLQTEKHVPASSFPLYFVAPHHIKWKFNFNHCSNVRQRKNIGAVWVLFFFSCSCHHETSANVLVLLKHRPPRCLKDNLTNSHIQTYRHSLTCGELMLNVRSTKSA